MSSTRVAKVRAAERPSASPKAKPAASWAWHAVPTAVVELIRASNLPMRATTNSLTVTAGIDPEAFVLRLRLRGHGRWFAQAAGNSPFGRTAAFKKLASRIRPRTDRKIRNLQPGGEKLFVDHLKSARDELRAASIEMAPVRPRIFANGLVFNRDELSTSVRAASAGLPSLGKRR